MSHTSFSAPPVRMEVITCRIFIVSHFIVSCELFCLVAYVAGEEITGRSSQKRQQFLGESASQRLSRAMMQLDT